MYYTKEDGIYYLNVDSVKTEIGEEVAIGFSYDKHNNKFTLLSHGRPENVREWYAIAVDRFLGLSMTSFADELIAVGSKEFHPIHINRILMDCSYIEVWLRNSYIKL